MLFNLGMFNVKFFFSDYNLYVFSFDESCDDYYYNDDSYDVFGSQVCLCFNCDDE